MKKQSGDIDTIGKKIQLEVEDRIAWIRMISPAGHSLSTSLLIKLEECITKVADDSNIKVIVIMGGDRHFATGADIEEMSHCMTASEAGEMSRLGQRVLLTIENAEKPVIAAINGFCLGGGLELAMSCHLRIATDKSIFGMPEISLGMIPAFGGSFRLPKLVGIDRAILMVLTGEKILSEEALSMGLITNVVGRDRLKEEVMKLALKLTERSAVSMKLALQSIRAGYDRYCSEMMKIESENMERLYKSHDLKEGVFAFLEKRKPKFTDS